MSRTRITITQTQILVPILENVSILVPTVTSETEEADVANGRNKKILNLY